MQSGEVAKLHRDIVAEFSNGWLWWPQASPQVLTRRPSGNLRPLGELLSSRLFEGAHPTPTPPGQKVLWEGFQSPASIGCLLVMAAGVGELVPGVAEGFFSAGEFGVVLDHHLGELLDGGLGLPAEFFGGFARVAEEEVNLGGA